MMRQVGDRVKFVLTAEHETYEGVITEVNHCRVFPYIVTYGEGEETVGILEEEIVE